MARRWPAAPTPPSAAPAGTTQAFHRDFVSYHAGIEYFVLGNGRIQAVLQTAATPEAGTHAGLFLMSPEHFNRKASSFLYHPERGAENTRVFVMVDRRDFVPEFGTSRVAWTFPEGVPTVRLGWAAGSVGVVEELTTPAGRPALVRTVRFRNTGAVPVTVAARVLLYPNLMLFDEYAVDRARRELSARGFHALHLTGAEATRVGDRHLQFDLGPLAPGAERTITLVWSIGDEPTRVAAGGLRPLSRDLRARFAGRLAVSVPVWRARQSRGRKSRAGVARVALVGGGSGRPGRSVVGVLGPAGDAAAVARRPRGVDLGGDRDVFCARPDRRAPATARTRARAAPAGGAGSGPRRAADSRCAHDDYPAADRRRTARDC